MFCAKSIYVHLVKSGRGVLLDLYFIRDILGSPCSKWPLGSSALCESIQFLLNQAYGKSSIIEIFIGNKIDFVQRVL